MWQIYTITIRSRPILLASLRGEYQDSFFEGSIRDTNPLSFLVLLLILSNI